MEQNDYVEMLQAQTRLETEVKILKENACKLEGKMDGALTQLTESVSKLVTMQEVMHRSQELMQKSYEETRELQKATADQVVELARIVSVMQERQEMSMKSENNLRAEVNNIKASINSDKQKNNIDVRDIVKKVVMYIIMAVVGAGVAFFIKGG
jgi:replicative superfamily II helicase